MKTKILCLASTVAAAAYAVPVVQNLTFEQRTDKKVDITYTLTETPAIVTLDIQTNFVATVDATTLVTNWVTIGLSNIYYNLTDGSEAYRKVDGSGVHTICWKPLEAWMDDSVPKKFNAGKMRAVVTAWSTNAPPDYMVVDISDGARPNTQRYFQSADFVPEGVTNSATYRTTALLMRRICAKGATVTLGPLYSTNTFNAITRTVTLSNDFYMAVFETTQGQWRQIMGEYPPARSESTGNTYSYTNEVYRDMRPAQNISYTDIRTRIRGGVDYYGEDKDWPNDPEEESFLGRLRNKTGIAFDLPRENEWEYACLCGRSNGYWNNGAVHNNLDGSMPGRHMDNGGADGTDYSCGPESGTAICGSYEPSSWGIYDMHGNLREWCVDAFKDSIKTKVVRGGAYSDAPYLCRQHVRKGEYVTLQYFNLGCRVVCPL